MKRLIYLCLVFALAFGVAPAFAADSPSAMDEEGAKPVVTTQDTTDSIGTDAPSLDYDSD